MTLTGIGGVGKTRLALRVADDLRRAFADGTWFVSLSSTNEAEWLPHTIAGTLGLHSRSTRTAPGALIEYLRHREALLVLDNCEHMIAPCAALTELLLRNCPRLKVLTTSRQPLHIPGEFVHAVRPLRTPNRGATEPLVSFESVNLFVERGQASTPSFNLTDINREAIGEICRRLAGIPLALELAAVRLRSMTPVELLTAMSERHDLLTHGGRNVPDRQQTMAACIEWTFELCSRAEREVWARMAVFSGGFELDAATAVCSGRSDDTSLHDVLFALVDKSVLSADTQGTRTRFRMLIPLRERGMRLLQEEGRLASIRQKHCEFYVDLSGRVAADWMSSRQLQWIHRLRSELNNMQAALEYCSGDRTAEAGVRLGANLLEYGLVEGLFRAGRQWFDRLLPDVPTAGETRALALRTACWWATMQGDMSAARALLVEATDAAEGQGDHVRNRVTQLEGFVAMFAGEPSRAISLLTSSIGKFRTEGDLAQVAHTLSLAQLACVFDGQVERSFEYHRQCLAITEPVDEFWVRAHTLWIAGLAHLASGSLDDADRIEREALSLMVTINERLGIGVCLEALAWIDTSRDAERAAVLLGAAERHWEVIDTSTKALPGLHAQHRASVSAISLTLDESAYAAARASGRALNVSAAIDYAMRKNPTVGPPDALAQETDEGPLTRREKQIAELVAAGMSNRDIAAKAVISKRTAETHVANIIAKLGFSSRHEVVAWMADKRSVR